MHKFFVNKDSFSLNSAVIQGDDVKHIYKVLRLQVGDKVNVNNCEGSEFLAEISEINKSFVRVNIIESLQLNNESPIQVQLYQGLPKSSKMDFIVQKGTELGVKNITPVITERVVVKSELAEFRKTDRWKRIALEACKQSKRSIIPEVGTPIEFQEMLSKLEHIDLVIVPYENEDGSGIKNVIKELSGKLIKSVGVVIGPEGGFEKFEIEKLKSIGAHIVTLGPRILRTETAGLTVVSILMYELGDMGGNN